MFIPELAQKTVELVDSFHQHTSRHNVVDVTVKLADGMPASAQIMGWGSLETYESYEKHFVDNKDEELPDEILPSNAPEQNWLRIFHLEKGYEFLAQLDADPYLRDPIWGAFRLEIATDAPIGEHEHPTLGVVLGAIRTATVMYDFEAPDFDIMAPATRDQSANHELVIAGANAYEAIRWISPVEGYLGVIPDLRAVIAHVAELVNELPDGGAKFSPEEQSFLFDNALKVSTGMSFFNVQTYESLVRFIANNPATHSAGVFRSAFINMGPVERRAVGILDQVITHPELLTEQVDIFGIDGTHVHSPNDANPRPLTEKAAENLLQKFANYFGLTIE